MSKPSAVPNTFGDNRCGGEKSVTSRQSVARRLRYGLRAVYISRELAGIQRRVADAIADGTTEGREPL
jgi:hypothetical protein